MNRRLETTILVFALIVAHAAVAADLPGRGDDVGKAVVYRDDWGVPHIYAPTVEAGLYAMGWAQAEDRPEQLLENMLRAMGESARFEGEGGLDNDRIAKLWDFYGAAREQASSVRPEVQAHLRAFVRGVNDFYKAHPVDVPEWFGGRTVDVPMVAAFGSLFLYSWSIDQALSDLQRGGIEPGLDEIPRASNQWSVAPSRSAGGAAILCIDPHLSWWGPSRFWEFRIHAGDFVGSGFTLAGFPYIGLGHNENVAWAMTTGGPDTADIYELTLKEDDHAKYRYDGEWRSLRSRKVEIEVLNAGTRTFTLLDSHYGPIIARKDGKAYAARMAYAGLAGAHEAWYLFNFAENYRGIVEGLATLKVFPQNVMAADTSGNIYYQRTGRVPRRPKGYDWTRPVDGSTSATEWQEFHPSSDHLQVHNPPQGYMQNCNISPDTMMAGSPFSIDGARAYLFGGAAGQLNQRGARALELLRADNSVTAAEARAYALDLHPYGVERWIETLKRADEILGERYRHQEEYVQALKEVLNWNGGLLRDSAPALKYYYWRRQLSRDLGREANTVVNRIDQGYRSSLGESTGVPDFDEKTLERLLTSFVKAIQRLKTDHGSLDAVYGDVFRVGRDEASWPVGGGGGDGLTTLRTISYGRERAGHTRWGISGQTSTQIVVLSKPIQSWTGPPIGQSDRPGSPHYSDQAEHLFSPRKLKATWWRPEELASHIQSRTVLEQAP